MVQCAAFGCNHNSGNPGVEVSVRVHSFHSFPIKRPLLLKKWLANIRRAQFTPTTHSRLCSGHFTADAFEEDLYGRYAGRSPGKVARRHLKADAFRAFQLNSASPRPWRQMIPATWFSNNSRKRKATAGGSSRRRRAEFPTGGHLRKPRLTSITRRKKGLEEVIYYVTFS